MAIRILLLSAYDAGSHRYWRQELVAQFRSYKWTVLTLPPRHFQWRIRSNSMYWAFEKRDILEQHYDLIITTSMTDLSSLRGMVPHLAQIPTLLYFHENQLAYPQSHHQRRNVEPAILNLYSALCADAVVFNSQYNYQSFIRGLTSLFARLPDSIPDGVVEDIQNKSSVIPVPLSDKYFQRTIRSKALLSIDGPIKILWNHRWEYDKAPDRFFKAMARFSDLGRPFHLYVVGQRFRRSPAIFETAQSRLGSHIKQWGYLKCRKDYEKLLRQCDLVISTALHDFQGLSILEAMAAGCYAITPDRLAYREYVPDMWRYPNNPDSPEQEIQDILRYLQVTCDSLPKLRMSPAPAPWDYSWQNQHQNYCRIIERLTSGCHPRK